MDIALVKSVNAVSITVSHNFLFLSLWVFLHLGNLHLPLTNFNFHLDIFLFIPYHKLTAGAFHAIQICGISERWSKNDKDLVISNTL